MSSPSPSHAPSGHRGLTHALLWALAMMGGQQGLAALVTFVLAGLLGPEAFGLVAMASIYVAFVQLFLEQGLGPAIIQRPELEDRHLDAAFWMVMALGAVLLTVSLAFSEWWAGVNAVPELARVIRWLSLQIPLFALTVVQIALLRRRMDFKVLALRSNVSVASGGVAGLSLAFAGYGVWALVAQHLVQNAVGAVLLWAVSDWRPRLRFERQAARDLLGFSSGAFLGRIGIFVGDRADALLIGLFFGPTAVGLYRLADRLMRLFVDLSTRVLQQVALPEFSRLQAERERLLRSLQNLLRTSASTAIPPLVVVAASSAQLTAFLGERWEPAATTLSILCGVGIVRALTVVTGPIMRALGRPHAHAAFVWSHALPSALTFWAVAVWIGEAAPADQAAGIAISRSVLYVALFLPINVWIVRSFTGLRFARLAGAAGPAFAGALVGGVMAWAAGLPAWPAWLPVLVQRTLPPLVGGAAAATCVIALDADFRERLLRLLARATGGRLGAAVGGGPAT